MFDAGTDVFRFNFSHGSHEDHRERLNIVRDIETRTGRPIAVLADLQGPKLRLGTMADGPFVIEEGAASVSTSTPRPATATGCRCRIRRSSRPCRTASIC